MYNNSHIQHLSVLKHMHVCHEVCVCVCAFNSSENAKLNLFVVWKCFRFKTS